MPALANMLMSLPQLRVMMHTLTLCLSDWKLKPNRTRAATGRQRPAGEDNILPLKSKMHIWAQLVHRVSSWATRSKSKTDVIKHRLQKVCSAASSSIQLAAERSRCGLKVCVGFSPALDPNPQDTSIYVRAHPTSYPPKSSANTHARTHAHTRFQCLRK